MGDKGLGAFFKALAFQSTVPNIAFAWVVALVVLGLGYVGGIGLGYFANPFALSVTNEQINPPADLGAGAIPSSGCPTLATTQTISPASYNVDQPSSTVASPVVVYLNPATGSLNPSGNTTQPRGTYTLYAFYTGYCGASKQITTGCDITNPVPIYQKNFDTSISASVFNADGVTANADTTAGRLAIASGSSATAHIKLLQSTSYSHLSCGKNEFAVFMNATNVTDWNPSQMSAVFDGKVCKGYTAYGYDGTPIVGATPTGLGAVKVVAWNCEGDFAPNDGSLHALDVKYQAGTGMAVHAQNTSICYAPVDYYQNTITGALEMGAVKDDGSAIQTLQCAPVRVS